MRLPIIEIPHLTVAIVIMPPALQVTAIDNNPSCFTGEVRYTQDIIDLPRACDSGIVYHLARTWSTSDGANNTRSYQQIVAVRDVEAITVPSATLHLTPTGTISHALSVPDPLPNKVYTWTVTQANSQLPLTRSKTGEHVSK